MGLLESQTSGTDATSGSTIKLLMPVTSHSSPLSLIMHTHFHTGFIGENRLKKITGCKIVFSNSNILRSLDYASELLTETKTPLINKTLASL